jgi:hypothetical protein
MSNNDIYNFKKRLEQIETGIQALNISNKDRAAILQFRDQCFADGLSTARVVKYMQSIKVLYDLASYNILEASESEIIALLAQIERSTWSNWTKYDYKIALRKYLTYCNLQDPAE